jgi:hypothetical protein
MSYFAKVDQGKVINVIRADQEFINNMVDTSPGEWIQTSYNTRGNVHYGADGKPDGGIPLRYNYACIGGTYDSIKDAFIPIKHFDSWVLDPQTCLWEAPIPYPAGGGEYYWDESIKNWVEIVE